MSWFSDQIAKGLSMIREVAGDPVTYRHAGTDIPIPKAVRRVLVQTDNQDYDQHTLSDAVKWDIEAALLKISGTAFLPAKGDTITEASGQVWQVVDDPVTGKCYSQPDPGLTVVKVFTIRKTPNAAA